MTVKKYVAQNMQKALKTIREELGDDAIILANRKLPNGKVEISVEIDNDPQGTSLQDTSIMDSSMPATQKNQAQSRGMEPLQVSNEKAKELLAAVKSKRIFAGQTTDQQPPGQLHQSQDSLSERQQFEEHRQNAQRPSSGRAATPALDDIQRSSEQTNMLNLINRLTDEMIDLKAQVSGQQSFGNTNPTSAVPQAKSRPTRVTQAVLPLAIQKKCQQIQLDQNILKRYASHQPQISSMNLQKLWRECLNHIKQSMPKYYRNPIETPGIYGFVGPTGSGKTTTLAKIAVRQAARWGADQVGIVTMDSFRIGAWEQMQRLGKISKIDTELCRHDDSLLDVVGRLRGRKFILVDTSGLSHKDERRSRQWQQMAELGDEIETFMVAEAMLQPSVYNQLVKTYRAARIQGFIFTKCDEATSLGEVVSLVIKEKIPWVFAANGQKIPDDLQEMTVDRVMKSLMYVGQNSCWDDQQHLVSAQEKMMVEATSSI